MLFLKYKQCHTRRQQFSNDRMISTNTGKSNTSGSQNKAPLKLLDTHVWGNPYKAQIVLRR